MLVGARQKRHRVALLALVGMMGCLLAAGAEGRGSAPNTWAGTWNTDFGPLILNASGSGTYYKGKGTVSGTIKGNVLEGTWTQPGRRGDFKFTMSADGRSFAGTWTYEGETHRQGWSGTCAAGPCLKNGIQTEQASGNTKTVAVPAPGASRAVTSPKPLPTRKKVGVTITGSKCRSTSSVTPRLGASSADCAPDLRKSAVVAEGGLTRQEKFGQALATCWIIGPEALRFKPGKVTNAELEKMKKWYDEAASAKGQLFFCNRLMLFLLVTGDLNLDLAVRTPQAAAGCRSKRVALAGPVRNGRFTSLRVVTGNPRPTDVRYGCTVSNEGLDVTIDGRTPGGLRKTLGTKLDLGVVRAKDADQAGGKLTFKFRW